MDNDTTVAPEGQTTPSPDVQSAPTAPTEAPVIAQTETETKPSDESSFESLAAKKGFKTPDDLAKAYANLERQSTKTSMKAAELEKSFFPQEARTDTPQAPVELKAEKDAIDELRNFGKREFVEPLKQEFDQRLKTELAKIELRQTIKENPDFSKYADEVKELKTKHPSMSFSEAYTFAKAMKGDLVQEATAKAYSEGAKVGYKQVAAQVAPTKPVTEDKIAASDLLQGAASRWKTGTNTPADVRARIKAEQAMVERELFGQELKGH